MELAPITLFVYNRPVHTKRTLEALKKNELAGQSDLFIFSDGPKGQNDQKAVQEVREYLKTVTGFNKVVITERPENWGLAKSIISGVGEVVGKRGKIIVLEDDLLTSPFFLRYMNDALNLYENEPKVMHINAYLYPTKEQLPQTFFVRLASSWGWGTWQRSWKNFMGDADFLWKKIKSSGSLKAFNLDAGFDFFSGQLQANIYGDMETWAIKWQGSIFLRGGLCLYPNISLVRNIGHDGSGTHSGTGKDFEVPDLQVAVPVKPIPITESAEGRRAITKFLQIFRPTPYALYRSRVRYFCKRIIFKLAH